MKIKLFIIFLIFSIFFSSVKYADEIQIYADSIDYDSKGNILAKGNVKIIDKNEILTSSIVVINQSSNKITLPKEFQYKDEKDNYYYGSSGEFSTDFVDGKIQDVKILLSDGTRIVGNEALKNNDQDLIFKGVFSPCDSKIKIKNFICPIWQLEGEKILHDRNNLFIHTKHAKMRIFNAPVYYFPYMIQPSPLRKKRKSGFLNPTISTNFLNTKTSQSISTPYYFAIDQDKELLLTPTINYGGGVDASQRIEYDYNQLTSGGKISLQASTDTDLEKNNNEHWLKDASIILNLNHNINKNYNISASSAFQSSPTYLRRTDQNNPLNRKSSLSSSVTLNGYEVFEPEDTLNFKISGYQVVRNNEDNKTTPTSLPYVAYNLGNRVYKGNNIYNKLTFYNLFREKSTDDHAQQQQKFEHVLKSSKDFYSLHSKFTFKTELYSQLYNIENKKNGNEEYTGEYNRIFPMSGLHISTPLVNKKHNIYITPKLFTVLNSSQTNSNKISNEESTDYQYTLLNFDNLNRYTGSDKLENSKRISYGFDINKDNLKAEIAQSYEFDKDRNDYTKNVGLNDYMSDLLGSSTYDGSSNDLLYNFRFNVDQGLMKSQSLQYTNENYLGSVGLNYTEDRKEVNSILETGSETLNLNYSTKEFQKYSKISVGSTFDLVNDDPTNYTFGYRYLDECFGVHLNFERSFYADRDLKPKDILTIMFSFKHLGSYKSSNLAVSETGKEDIRWVSGNVEESDFK
tara:strand:+ start:356 stop:2578 length:2223 start_codon:yes stop_codon:yes gene_type:complete